MAETFADGEPVDPQKLRNLQSQITEIKATAGAAYNLISTTANGQTTNSVFHTRSGEIDFENVKSGSLSTQGLDFAWDSTVYKNPVTVATAKISDPKTHEVRVAVKGAFAPVVNIYYSGKPDPKPLITITWISSAEKIV
jgi:hypothetical protein